MNARNGAAPATEDAVKQGPVIVSTGKRDRQLPSDKTQEIQDTRAAKIKSAEGWAKYGFNQARLMSGRRSPRWMRPDERRFTDRSPMGCGGKILAVDQEQKRAEAKIEMQRALRLAPGLYFLEAAE